MMKWLSGQISVLCVVICNSRSGEVRLSRHLRSKYKKEGRTREVGETVDELWESISFVEEPKRRHGYAVRTFPNLRNVNAGGT